MAEVEIQKAADGRWYVKGLDMDQDEYVRAYHKGYAFRDQPEVVDHILTKYPEIPLDHAYYKKWIKHLNRSNTLKDRDDLDFSHLTSFPPYAHQNRAIAFVLNLPGAALFAEPGTGKTFVALATAKYRLDKGLCKRVLIICPKSVEYTGWFKDALKFTDLEPHIIRNRKLYWVDPATGKRTRTWKKGRPEWLKQNKCKNLEERLASQDKIFITSIHLLSRNIDAFKKAGFDYIILDESTMIKSPGGSMSKNARSLASNADYRLALTGTPIANSLEDIWAQMKFVDNSLDDSAQHFINRYYRFPDPIGKPWLKKLKRGAVAEVIRLSLIHI